MVRTIFFQKAQIVENFKFYHIVAGCYVQYKNLFFINKCNLN